MLAIWFLAGSFLQSDESLTPAESLARIQLPPGLTAELVAAEPNVESPVAISFDERGRMFVAEYRDYPQGPKPGELPLSRIRLLEDRDGDGYFETSTIFADHLNFAQGVLAINGGVIVTAAPDILFLKDTNGDGVADEKKILFTGFKAGNPQLRVSHPRLGIDNLVYVSNGLSGGEIHHVAAKGPVVPLGRDDFRFDPKTMIGEATTGFGQFGNTFDDCGRRFTCSNRNPVMHSFLPKRVLNRNDLIPIPLGYADVAPSGSDSRVYPIARTNTTAESHAGTHTAACGVHVFRGDLLGHEYRGDIFVCEPTGYLVTRSKLILFKAGFRTERDRPNQDFLASSDTWFRPVSLADGPDGALYVVDMHREVIEHPDYLPKGVGANYRFRAGADKGRIIRIKAAKDESLPRTPSRFKSPQTTSDLLSLLSDWNGWRRDLGQRLLVERNAKEAVPELRRLLEKPNSMARFHALWTLRGLDALTAAELRIALADQREFAEQALLAGESMIIHEPHLQKQVVELAASTRPKVRLRAAVLMGDFENPEKIDALATAATRMRGFDPWIGRAVLSAAANAEGRIFSGVVRNMASNTQTPEFLEFSIELCKAAVNRGETETRAVLRSLAGERVSPDLLFPWQLAGLVGLAEGMSKPNPWKANGLHEFLRSPPKSLEQEAAAVRPFLAIAEKRAFERPQFSDSYRWLAIKLTALQPASAPRLISLLGSDEDAETQVAVLTAMSAGDSKLVVATIIEKWNSLPPAVQQAAVDFAFRRRDSQIQFLNAISAKKIPASVVGPERREMMLVFSNDKEIKPLAKKLFGIAASNRGGVINQYLPSTKQPGAPAKGAEVFKRVCANCHRLKNLGVAVGPELADVRQKSKETLLTDIIDPNRTVEPRWVASLVALKDGRIVSGLPISESATEVTLRLPNGVNESFPREKIERFKSTGRSLMPEGVEKDVTPAQMADLLEFLCSPN